MGSVGFKIHLLGADGRVPYCTIEATGTEPESLPNVLKEKIAFDLSLQSDLFNESDFVVVLPSPLPSEINSPSILGAISTPAQIYPSSSRISPERPDPHPMSSKKAGSPDGMLSSSNAR